MQKSLKGGDWLSDEHIVLAQAVLFNQFPHVDGFQTPLLSQNDGFIPVQDAGIYYVLSSSLLFY